MFFLFPQVFSGSMAVFGGVSHQRPHNKIILHLFAGSRMWGLSMHRWRGPDNNSCSQLGSKIMVFRSFWSWISGSRQWTFWTSFFQSRFSNPPRDHDGDDGDDDGFTEDCCWGDSTEGWSSKKKSWCCENYQKGCSTYDCYLAITKSCWFDGLFFANFCSE